MASTVNQPEPRDLGMELGGITDSSSQVFDRGMDFAKDFGVEALKMYPYLTDAERTATSQQRTQDIRQLGKLGPKIYSALGKISPEWAQAGDVSQGLDRLATGTMDLAGQSGPNPLRLALEGQATNDLSLGRFASSEQLRDASQTARAAYSDRGILDSNPALASEVLSTDAYQQALQDQRRQFAAGVAGLGIRDDESVMNRRVASGNLGNMAAGVAQNRLSPILSLFAPRTSVSPLAGSELLQGYGGVMQGMAPLMNYGSDLYNTNFNSQLAVNSANAQAQNALTGAIIEATGQAIGGAMSMCWVAREILGEHETATVADVAVPKWILFRQWLIENAPDWVIRLYRKHGAAAAKWLHRHPVIKRALLPWFEGRVCDQVESIRSGDSNLEHLLTGSRLAAKLQELLEEDRARVRARKPERLPMLSPAEAWELRHIV